MGILRAPAANLARSAFGSRAPQPPILLPRGGSSRSLSAGGPARVKTLAEFRAGSYGQRLNAPTPASRQAVGCEGGRPLSRVGCFLSVCCCTRLFVAAASVCLSFVRLSFLLCSAGYSSHE